MKNTLNEMDEFNLDLEVDTDDIEVDTDAVLDDLGIGTNSESILEEDVNMDLEIETDSISGESLDLNLDVEVDSISEDTYLDIEADDSKVEIESEELEIETESEPISNNNLDLEVEVESNIIEYNELSPSTDGKVDMSKVIANINVGALDDSEYLEIESSYDTLEDLFSDSDVEDIEIETEPLKEEVKETEEERQERLLNTKIKKWQRLRDKVNIEENIEALEDMLDEASLELKNYINNIHSTLSLDYESEATFVDTDNISREYFELLRHWFKLRYLEHITSGSSYTPKEFIETDIKQDLLSLGARLDENVRRYVASQPKFTPLNLLNNEYSIQQLLKVLDDEVDISNLKTVNSDRRKSERSSLVVSLTKEYLPNNLNEDGEYVLVKQIIVEDKESYICGKCGEEALATQPFFLMGVIPLRSEIRNKIRQHRVVRIPGINKCPHCGANNMLSADEINELVSRLEKTNANNIDKFVDAAKTFCSGFKFTRYRGNSNFLYTVLPHVYSKVDYTAEEVVEQTYDADLGEAYLRYIKLLKFFRNNLKLNANLESVTMYDEITTKNAEQAPQGNILNSKVFKEYVFNEAGCYNLKQLVKILCSCVGKDYHSIKVNAENSLISSIINSPYYSKLKYTTGIATRMAYESKDVVNYLDELEDENLAQIISDFCTRYGIKMDKYIKDNKVIKEELQDFKHLVKSTLESKKKVSEDLIREREELIEQLLNNIRLLSFTPIVTMPFTNDALATELLVDERLVRFINMTSDFMILNDISVEVLEFLEPTRTSKFRNAFNNLKEAYPSNLERYIEILVTDFNIASFRTGTKKDAKNMLLRNMFTCFSGLDFEALSHLDKVKKAYDDNDEFDFFTGVYECSLNLRLFSLCTPIFNPIANALLDLREVAKHFIETYGSTELDRICYYLGDKFSREEIEANYIKAYATVSLNKQLEKKPNEKFVDYMSRLSNINKLTDRSGIIEFENKFMDKCDKFAVVLSSCNLPMLFLNTFGKPFNLTLTMIEIFYQLLLKDLKGILDSLGIDAGLANKLAEVEDCEVELKSSNKLYATTALRNLFYLDTGFNFTGDASTLISEESMSGEGELDLDVDTKRFLKLATEDLERFEKATKHVPREVKDIIYECYTFGERED